MTTITINQISEAQPITVRGGYWVDGIFDLDWCNHAGAEYLPVVYYRGSDHEEVREELVCDKCDAVTNYGGWQ